VSADTATKSSDVKTFDVKEDKGDVQSPKATTVPSPERQAAETPRPHLGRKGFPHQAPARWTTPSRTRGRRRPRPSLASRILGRQPSKSVVLLTTWLCFSSVYWSFA
jgi:hypothetical protein